MVFPLRASLFVGLAIALVALPAGALVPIGPGGGDEECELSACVDLDWAMTCDVGACTYTASALHRTNGGESDQGTPLLDGKGELFIDGEFATKCVYSIPTHYSCETATVLDGAALECHTAMARTTSYLWGDIRHVKEMTETTQCV